MANPDTTAELLSALPALAGGSVLVVGCGDGRYPRLFRRGGARRVMGVDADQALIAVAQREEERDPVGISYEVHVPARLPVMGSFEIVVALLDTTEDFDAMVTRLSANLVPGGVLTVRAPGDLPLVRALRDAGFHDIEEHAAFHSARKPGG